MAVEWSIMSSEVVVKRNPDFARLEHDIALATARLTQAAQAKQRFVAELGTQRGISLEDRKRFMDLLKTEQEAYHAMHDIQQKIVEMLRAENQSSGDAKTARSEHGLERRRAHHGG